MDGISLLFKQELLHHLERDPRPPQEQERNGGPGITLSNDTTPGRESEIPYAPEKKTDVNRIHALDVRTYCQELIATLGKSHQH